LPSAKCAPLCRAADAGQSSIIRQLDEVSPQSRFPTLDASDKKF
jgi:hypothetical protein